MERHYLQTGKSTALKGYRNEPFKIKGIPSIENVSYEA